MSSPGVMHARQFEPIDWKGLDGLDAQEAHAYPASYEEARRRLLSSLLSMPTTPLKESNTAAVPGDPVTDIDPRSRACGQLRASQEQFSRRQATRVGRVLLYLKLRPPDLKKAQDPCAACTSPNWRAPAQRPYSHGRARGRCVRVRIARWRLPGPFGRCSQFSERSGCPAR